MNNKNFNRVMIHSKKHENDSAPRISCKFQNWKMDHFDSGLKSKKEIFHML